MKHIAIKSTNAPLLVGITGASGVIYGVRLLELLRACNIETHLIVPQRMSQHQHQSGSARNPNQATDSGQHDAL